jgi:AcrR family transcriptional regulator
VETIAKPSPIIRRRGPAKSVGRGVGRAEEMLETALALFAEHGYANVTIKDIARSASINSASIYYYYADKAALFHAAIEHAIARTLARNAELTAEDSGLDPWKVIEAWFRSNVELFVTLSRALKLMLDYRAEGLEMASVEQAIRQFYATEVGLLESCIERGVASGQFRAVDPRRTALLISTHLDGLTIASMIREDVEMPAATADFRFFLQDYLLGRRD